MKKLITLIIAVITMVGTINAQTTLTKATHGFEPGKIHESVEVNYQDPGDAGKGLVWDFREAMPLEEKESSYSSISAGIENTNIRVDRATDGVAFFYNITERGNEYFGYDNGKQRLTLNTPILKTAYPQTFGTYFDGSFSGEISYVNSQSITLVRGTFSTHADAEGTLILPSGLSIPVMRVHTMERTEYSGYAQINDKYLWYTQGVRLPVFVSLQSSLETQGKISNTSTRSFMNLHLEELNSPTAIVPTIDDVAYFVSPNPFDREVRVSYYLPEATRITVELYNVSGQKLASWINNETQSGSQSFEKDMSTYTAQQGIYLLKLTFGDKVYTEKLIKSKN